MGMGLMLGVVIGTVFGFCLSLLLKKGNDGSSKIKELKADHEKYRKQVDDHFVNTAVLFKGLTDQYRDVYRHIASGAGELCSEEAKALQIDLEETALLASSTGEAELADEVAPVASSEVLSKNESLEGVGQPAAEGESESEGSSINDDEVPLASEVEMSADIAEEIKSQANKKVS